MAKRKPNTLAKCGLCDNEILGHSTLSCTKKMKAHLKSKHKVKKNFKYLFSMYGIY